MNHRHNNNAEVHHHEVQPLEHTVHHTHTGQHDRTVHQLLESSDSVD